VQTCGRSQFKDESLKKKITATVVPVHAKKAYGELEVHHIFLTLAQDGG